MNRKGGQAHTGHTLKHRSLRHNAPIVLNGGHVTGLLHGRGCLPFGWPQARCLVRLILYAMR